ncbi:MAG TPA: hypothetical protein PLR86_09040, partial [Planctomycetota bacterium]|nr:hypothetical protein [Planctomycetota bacterium]
HGGAIYSVASNYNQNDNSTAVIASNSSIVLIQDSILSNNVAQTGAGGAIFNQSYIKAIDQTHTTNTTSASVTIENSTLNNNQATTAGGAVYNRSYTYISRSHGNGTTTYLITANATATMVINNSDFGNNIVSNGSGGAIYNIAYAYAYNSYYYHEPYGYTYGYNYSQATIQATITIDKDLLSDSTFTNNQAQGGSGGAIFNQSLAKAFMATSTTKIESDNSKFTSNTASVSGGAIFNISQTYSSTSDEFTYNYSNSQRSETLDTSTGTSNASVIINNGTFTTNTANTGSGGAIYNYSGAYAYHHNDHSYGINTLQVTTTSNANVTITNSAFNQNNAAIHGGALFNESYAYAEGYKYLHATVYSTINATSSANVALNQVTFHKNNAGAGYGGAVYNKSYAKAFANSRSANDPGHSTATVNSTASVVATQTTITENTATYGGGIYNRSEGHGDAYSQHDSSYYDDWNFSTTHVTSAATVTIQNNSIISKNQATNGQGGGIYNYSYANSIARGNNYSNESNESHHNSTAINTARVTILGNSSVDENIATQEGGGIYNYGWAYAYSYGTRSAGGWLHYKANTTNTTTIQVTNSTIKDNTSGLSGGAIYNYGKAESIVTKGEGSNTGGNYTINATNTTTLTFTNAILDNNKANSGDGGAVYNYSVATSTGNGEGATSYDSCTVISTTASYATITINNSTFRNNTATGAGGAIYNLNLADSQARSQKGYDGNAYATSNSTAHTTITVIDSTIAKNTAGTSGGGIYTSNTANSYAWNSPGTYGTGSSTTTSNTKVTITVSNSTIANNKALNGIAGGIYNYNEATGKS